MCVCVCAHAGECVCTRVRVCLCVCPCVSTCPYPRRVCECCEARVVGCVSVLAMFVESDVPQATVAKPECNAPCITPNVSSPLMCMFSKYVYVFNIHVNTRMCSYCEASDLGNIGIVLAVLAVLAIGMVLDFGMVLALLAVLACSWVFLGVLAVLDIYVVVSGAAGNCS